jgi:lipid A 3-O-deacylase
MNKTAALLLAMPMLAASLAAQSWSLLLDNDILFGSDGEYTGGIQIGWMSDELNATREESFERGYIVGMSDLLTAIYPFDLGSMRRNGAISIQGTAITPRDTKSKTPVYNDVPYMGATSATFTLFIWNERLFHGVSLVVGAIGPISGAAFAQTTFHRAIGNTEPQGWDNQLGNRLLLQANYLVGARQYVHRFKGDHVLEWFNDFFADVGSLYVGAGGGSILRFGRNMPKNFAEMSGFFSRSLVRQLNPGSRTGTWGWDANIGIGVNALGYFYLYEASKAQGYEYDRPSAFLLGRIGIDLYYKNWQVAIEAYPSRSLDRYISSDNFGRVSLVWWIP